MSTKDGGPPKANFDKIMGAPLPKPGPGTKAGQLPKDGEAMPSGKPANSVGPAETDKLMKDHPQDSLGKIAEGGGRKRSRRRSRRKSKKRRSKKRRSKKRRSTKRKRSTKRR